MRLAVGRRRADLEARGRRAGEAKRLLGESRPREDGELRERGGDATDVPRHELRPLCRGLDLRVLEVHARDPRRPRRDAVVRHDAEERAVDRPARRRRVIDADLAAELLERLTTEPRRSEVHRRARVSVVPICSAESLLQERANRCERHRRDDRRTAARDHLVEVREVSEVAVALLPKRPDPRRDEHRRRRRERRVVDRGHCDLESTARTSRRRPQVGRRKSR